MMPAPYSADLRWWVLWFIHILQNSVAEASFFLGVCERTVERYISKFLVNGHVKPGASWPFVQQYQFSATRRTYCKIWKPQFLSVVQFPFDNCHSPLSPTTFFEIGVYMGSSYAQTYACLFRVCLCGTDAWEENGPILGEKNPQSRKGCKYTWQKDTRISGHNFGTSGRPYIWPVNHESFHLALHWSRGNSTHFTAT